MVEDNCPGLMGSLSSLSEKRRSSSIRVESSCSSSVGAEAGTGTSDGGEKPERDKPFGSRKGQSWLTVRSSF